MHLIRTIDDTHCPARRVHVRERSILTNTCTAIGLDRPVDNLKIDLGDEDLDFGNFLERTLGIGLVDFDSGIENSKARGVDFDTRACDALEHNTVLIEKLAEGLLALVVDARQEPFQCLLGRADAPHGVVDAARAKTALDDFEATALAKDHIAGRHAHVLKGNMAVAVRCVVEAEDGQHTVDGDTGDVVGHEDDGLLLVFVGVLGVGLTKNDEDLAARVTNARGPPFLRNDEHT
jgi:hypothetical protein